MKIIHTTDPHIGSLDWELPTRLAEHIDMLPESMQKQLLDDVEKLVHGHLIIVVATLHLGPQALAGLNIVRVRDCETASLMGRFTRMTDEDDF